MEVESISFQEQFHVLIDMLRDPQGKPYSISTLAQAAHLSDQSLLYLLEGRSQYPRLETIRLRD
jgi:DNA-binding IscR family transcriptional regulator